MSVIYRGDPDAIHLALPSGSSTLIRPFLGHVRDFCQLIKPRILALSLFTVAIGFWFGSGGTVSSFDLINTLFGFSLVAAGGSALNQLFERHIDSRMLRTRSRPIPAGRITPYECAIWGSTLVGTGLAYLWATLHPASALTAALTFALYVCIYTPLKTCTVWNTVIGAISGALPPVIGWYAACGWNIHIGVCVLFMLLFIWQIPHFLAIAWIYRDDYNRGGLCMLPSVDKDGSCTAAIMVLSILFLLPIGFLGLLAGICGWTSVVGSILLGALFLISSIRFAYESSEYNARRVLRMSLYYLPCMLLLFFFESAWLWQQL
ncbi:MAG: heme o synthase [Candidatus Bilamarchaeaceae archaeon]